MGIALSTYYNLTRIREMSPDAADWAVTDNNFDLISRLFKAFENHVHNGAQAITYPGYNSVTPTSPGFTASSITQSSTGGVLTPGTVVGVRLSFLNNVGLETDACPEVDVTVGTATTRPAPPTFVAMAAGSPGLTGGTYIYVLTKKRGTGETVASDILPVSIPYDSTYSVTLAFDPINSYTDGTEGINIYRSTGLNQAFQLVSTVTVGTTASFIDTNTIAPGNQNVQPPATNTFDATNKITIDWGGLTVPAEADFIRVYVTQQTGIWGNRCLLYEGPVITTGGPPPGSTPPTTVDYLGSESLSPGTPANASEIPNSPNQIDLGGTMLMTLPMVLTNNIDFAGNQALNIKLHNKAGAPTSPTNGFVYYDTSINNVRAYINGSWVNWGTSTSSAYTHPAEESGGHLASNINYVAGTSTNNVGTILGRIVNSTGNRKQVTNNWTASISTLNPFTTSTGSTTIPELTLSVTGPDFDQQLYDMYFDCTFLLDTAGMILYTAFEVDGALSAIRLASAPVANFYLTQTQLRPFKVASSITSPFTVAIKWWVSTGKATAVDSNRRLHVKQVF